MALTLPGSALGLGKVIQVVQGTSKTATATTSTTYVTSTLSASITPSSASSKVLVLFSTGVAVNNASYEGALTIFRGTVAGTNLGAGNGGFGYFFGQVWTNYSAVYLDSPATTSATTYTVGIRSGNASTTVTAQYAGAQGVIVLVEIAP